MQEVTEERDGSLLRREVDFRRFWLGQTISVVGTQVTAVALPIIAAIVLDAGVGAVSVILTCAFLPNVVVPLWAGAWLETRRRRPVMIVADIVRAVALALVPVAASVGVLSVPVLAGVAFVVGAAGVVFDIGSFAYVPDLVDEEDLAGANQAMQGSATAAQVAGPGLAGLLVDLAGAVAAIVIDAVSYLASALGVAAARRPEPAPPTPDPSLRITEGLRAVARHPILRALTIHAAIYNAAAQILTVNLVIYVIRTRGVEEWLYGLALSASGFGAFVGTLVARPALERFGYGRTFAFALVLSTGLPLTIALIGGDGPRFAIVLAVIQLGSGIGLGAANVLSVTLRQIVVPRGSLARTNGGYRLAIFGVIPIGSALGGIIGATFGSRTGVAVGSIGLALSAIPMLRPPVSTLQYPHDAAASSGSETRRR